MLKEKILIISGITSIGKSNIAKKIAQILNTDIIIADSLQVQNEKNIKMIKK